MDNINPVVYLLIEKNVHVVLYNSWIFLQNEM